MSAAGNARTVAEHNQKQLAILAEHAYLPDNPGTPQSGAPYDSQDVARLQRNAVAQFEAVQSGYADMAARLQGLMTEMESSIFGRWQQDPESDQKSVFLREDSVIEAHEAFASARAIAQSSLHLERALGREPELALATLERLAQAQNAFKQKQELALAASRLPEPATSDPDLTGIAKRILATPRYEFGEHGPIVLTTASIVERERKSSEVDIDDVKLTLGGDLRMSGTETTWTYRWQEFKFATPLRADDGNWHIWWITARNFSSGGDNTPIGEWVSGQASRGDPILPQNF